MTPRQVDAKFTIHFRAVAPNGYDTVVTIRTADLDEIEKPAMQALAWLERRGFTPTHRREGR